MAKHKKIKISTSPDSVDRRARQLLHHHLQGEMDAYELSEEYEKIRAAGIYGPEFISLYMTHAIQTNQVDHRILSFMDAGNRRYPDHVKIRMGLLQLWLPRRCWTGMPAASTRPNWLSSPCLALSPIIL